MASKLTLLNNRIMGCHLCKRLVIYREKVSLSHRPGNSDQKYWGKPVPGFGRADAEIVIVGLAPGAHGANRTGRMFTGDSSGDFLFAALNRAGLASQAESVDRDDGLRLSDCYLTGAVRCVPPANRPTAEERRNCRNYLAEEFKLLLKAKVYLCLGQIAFEEVQRAMAASLGRFSHGACYEYQGIQVLCSYHVSRRNTQTGRLTQAMFDRILSRAKWLTKLDPLPFAPPANRPPTLTPDDATDRLS